MSKISLLVHERKYKRKTLTEHYNRRHDFEHFSLTEKNNIKLKLEEIYSELKVLNQQIKDAKFVSEFNEQEMDIEFESCNEYSDKYYECISMLTTTEIITTPDPVINVNTNANSQFPNESARSLLKSPTAPLPKFFSRDGEDLEKFLREFEDTISKFRYSEYDKFLLLKQQIEGRASFLLSSLDSDNHTYTEAKELLMEALATPIIQKFNAIKKLIALKLDYNSEPFEFISDLKYIISSFDKLEIEVNDFIQYFSWSGLNESFKNHLRNLSGQSIPSLIHITNYFFDACHRYKDQQKRFKTDKIKNNNFKLKENPHLAYAVNVNYNKNEKKCYLCLDSNNFNHYIQNCPKFVKSSDKINRIRKLHGCVKCGYINHETKNCKYKFKNKCIKCYGWHMIYLCPKDEKSESCLNDNKSSVTNSNVEKFNDPSVELETSGNVIALTEAFKCSIEGQSILPTFSCKIFNLDIRGLKDGGCQSNFVTNFISDKLQLKIIENNVKIKIQGINDSKDYYTKLVELPVDFGFGPIHLRAICLPKIDIHLKLDGLKNVARGFEERGYRLADKFLCQDYIKNVEFILGSVSSHCIPETDVLFGENNDSVYSSTPLGVLLKGDIKKLNNDLKYLKNITEISSACYNIGIELNNVNSSNMKEFLIEDLGRGLENKINEAKDNILDNEIIRYIDRDYNIYDESTSDVNSKLIKFTIDNTIREEDGRLLMPLLWNSSYSHLLGKNKNLSVAVLNSNFKKLSKNKDKLKMIDQVFKDQESRKIIQKIANLDEFLEEHPECSFLPHMSVFKLDRDTTKTRVVFLSNLCERDVSKPVTMSHNQVIHSGPCLNQKLGTTLFHLRFDRYLICYDLSKAFNMISLSSEDSNKLLFLWYRNIEKEDYSLVAYKNIRLPFGLRCSPTLLMIALFKILIIDAKDDNERLKYQKKLMYNLCYMDNLAFSSESEDEIVEVYKGLKNVFGPYQFDLQQFVTNVDWFQREIDGELEIKTDEKVKLLGLMWNRVKDSIFLKSLYLNENANTKRSVLSSIASNFDLFNFCCPLMNRSRLFMHTLQCDPKLNWDDKLSSNQLNEWKNICKQLNCIPSIEISRYIGPRSSSYRIIAFSDSSKLFYGTVVYLQELNTNKVNFLIAKNKLINKQLEDKSIPSLELLALNFATETVVDVFKELSSSVCVIPINIKEINVYSDSLVVLHWLNSYAIKLDKMSNKSVFVMNRLNQIVKLCQDFPVKFSFTAGLDNPADIVTKCFSYKKLMKTNFFTGPDFLIESKCSDVSFVIPNSDMNLLDTQTDKGEILGFSSNLKSPLSTINDLIKIENYSSFYFVVKIIEKVLVFINKLKSKVKSKKPNIYENLKVKESGFFKESMKKLLILEQSKYYSDVFNYFSLTRNKFDAPDIVYKLNLFVDTDGLIKVKGKCHYLKTSKYKIDSFPILLSSDSYLTKLIILNIHEKTAHSGKYVVLNELRRKFWIPRCFSIVKKQLRNCIFCKRLNERSIKLNQSPYRIERLSPIDIPFSQVYMDYLGPFNVKINNVSSKIWILCITCMWSRAINLKICDTLSTQDFLRSLQLHCFEYGLPQFCFSDLGSQMVAGGNLIMDYFNDPETKIYFEEKGISPTKFQQYYKGNSELGGIVEICVKMTKRLIYGFIKKNVLSRKDFEFMIHQTIHLVNRRPIAFKEVLSEIPNNEVPEPITPEKLIKGYDLESVNIIPNLHFSCDRDWLPDSDAVSRVRSGYFKLNKVRNSLIEDYNNKFLSNLIYQSVNVKDRYKPVLHKTIKKGDLVLVKEEFSKPINYPMARVEDVLINVNNEITGAILKKGLTGELIKRHSKVIIPLLTAEEPIKNENKNLVNTISARPRRRTAEISKLKTKCILDNN